MSDTTIQEFSPFDPNLPFLAASAAIAIDNRLIGQDSDLKALASLAQRLRALAVGNDDDVRRNAFAEPVTVDVFNRAILSTGTEPIPSLQSLIERSRQIVGDLEAAETSEEEALLIRAKKFCVALSKTLTEYHRNRYESGAPSHPLRA